MLGSDYPVEKIEVAGSYEDIGYALGRWYKAHDVLSRRFTKDEQARAREMLDFYQDLHWSIIPQLRGIYAAYGLNLDDLSHGIPIWDEEGIRFLLPGLVEKHSCSVVFTRPDSSTDGHARLARNHDWPTPISDALLVFTHPEDGFPTVVMTRSTPGFSASDGMNSRGLAFGLASVRNPGYSPPSGPALPANAAYRLVLEHSATVDEAIDMLRSFQISFINPDSEETISHILLADRNGNSAVVEFLPDGIVVSRADTPYQVMTNNHWAGPADQFSCERYQLAVEKLEENEGKEDLEMIMDVMSAVQGSTQWTIVYDLDDLSLVLSLPSSGSQVHFYFSLADFILRMETR